MINGIIKMKVQVTHMINGVITEMIVPNCLQLFCCG